MTGTTNIIVIVVMSLIAVGMLVLAIRAERGDSSQDDKSDDKNNKDKK